MEEGGGEELGDEEEEEEEEGEKEKERLNYDQFGPSILK